MKRRGSFAGSSTQLAPMWSQCRMGSTQLEAPLDGQEVARNHAQVIAFKEAGAQPARLHLIRPLDRSQRFVFLST